MWPISMVRKRPLGHPFQEAFLLVDVVSDLAVFSSLLLGQNSVGVVIRLRILRQIFFQLLFIAGGRLSARHRDTEKQRENVEREGNEFVQWSRRHESLSLIDSAGGLLVSIRRQVHVSIVSCHDEAGPRWLRSTSTFARRLRPASGRPGSASESRLAAFRVTARSRRPVSTRVR